VRNNALLHVARTNDSGRSAWPPNAAQDTRVYAGGRHNARTRHRRQHCDFQSHQRGSGLLKDATLRTLQAADIAGIRAMAVHGKDDSARAFYERYGFVAAPTDPYHLFVLLKDVRAILK